MRRLYCVTTAVRFKRVRRSTGLALAATALAAVAPVCAAASLARVGPFVSRPQAVLPREGHPLLLRGRVRGAPRGAIVLLQAERSGGWRTLARLRLRGSLFAIEWHPLAEERVIRFAVASPRGRVVVVGGARRVSVGSGPMACRQAEVPPLNPGEGAIVGGVYVIGGVPPGVDFCGGGGRTVVDVLSSSGAVVASQPDSFGQSYVFDVPPGSYQLRIAGVDYCRGEAAVSAGAVTYADIECPVP